MSLLIRYKFDQPTASLTIDSSGNSNTLQNLGGVVSVNDATYGSVASFTGELDSRFTTVNNVPVGMTGLTPRTISFWFKQNTTGNGGLYEYGDLTERNRAVGTSSSSRILVYTGSNNTCTISFSIGSWVHYTLTYSSGTFTCYGDGVELLTWASSANVPAAILYVGAIDGTAFPFDGCMSDFRVYDDAFSSSEVSAMFSSGPNPPPLTVTMFTHVADLGWESVTGVTDYTVTSKKDAGPEITLTTTSELSHGVYNLTQGSSYEFSLYTDLDTVTPIDTSTNNTPLLVDSINVDSLMTRLGNDLTLLNSTSVGEIQTFIPSALSTNEIVTTVLGESVFVANSETITLSGSNTSVLTPFDASSGSGQTATIILPDGSTNLVTFDETTEQVNISSTNYSVGEQFIVGGTSNPGVFT